MDLADRMTSGGSPRAAGVLLATSALATAVVRGLAWWYSGFALGPVLGGLTAPLILILPGRADATVPIVELAELVMAILIAALTVRVAVTLFKEEPPARGRLTRLTRWLLGLSGLHVAAVLGVLPFFESVHVNPVFVVAFAALSLVVMAMVAAAQRAARLWA